MKGVLALDVGNGKVEQLVYQGVHMNYSGELLGLIKQVGFAVDRREPHSSWLLEPLLAHIRISHTEHHVLTLGAPCVAAGPAISEPSGIYREASRSGAT